MERLILRSTPGGWALLVDEPDQVAWCVSTKAKALTAGRAAARDLAAPLVVENQSGDVLRTYRPGGV